MITDDVKKWVAEAVDSINEKPDDQDTLKFYSCSFYKKGKNPDCKGCLQDEDTVKECSEDFMSMIEARPMEYWTPAFDAPEVRDKVNPDTLAMGMNCDSCYMSDKCPLFKANSLCAIDWSAGGIDATDPKEVVKYLAKVQLGRIQRAQMVEKIDGGVPDALMSSEMDRMTDYMNQLQDLSEDKFKLSIEASGKGAKGVESAGGVLAALFAPKAPAETPKEEVEDAEATVVESTVEEAEVIEEKPSRRRRRKKSNNSES